MAAVGVRLVVSWTSAGADPIEVCPDTPHRFETFSLVAPALERAKQILVNL